MISDERLKELADVKMICICKDEEYQEMAKELLAHRKAWSEPAEYQYRYYNHGAGCFNGWERVYNKQEYDRLLSEHGAHNDFGFRILYRKPSTK